ERGPRTPSGSLQHCYMFVSSDSGSKLLEPNRPERPYRRPRCGRLLRAPPAGYLLPTLIRLLVGHATSRAANALTEDDRLDREGFRSPFLRRRSRAALMPRLSERSASGSAVFLTNWTQCIS